jgi:RNA polymerase sigma factor (sigma-70 family)
LATSQMSEVIQHLRKAVLLRDGARLTDGQLLESYIRRRDGAALEALVQRHGPMVWGVCRRVLRNYHDAEDAFQATFLVLVRRAASIASREFLANWLYGVAHQTALKARATAAKRSARERQVKEMPEPEAVQQDLWHDLKPLLDQELSRLPDKYRTPIVLCDLEGKTRKEAARQLGCPEGTVAGRLARARVMLAKRLAQRGVVLSGGALAVGLSQNAASACVPSSVVSCTIKTATLYAAGQGTMIPAKVAALTEGVLKSMLLNKLKMAMVVLMLAVLSGGAGVIYQTQAAQGNAQTTTDNGGKAKQPTAKKDQKPESDVERFQQVQIRIAAPVGMKVSLWEPSGKDTKVASIDAPGRLNLEPGKRTRLKVYDIPNRPGVERFPTVEIPKTDAVTEPFVTSSAIPIEFTDEDFDHVNGGRAITKVVYLTTGGKKTAARPMGPGAPEPEADGKKAVSRPGGSGPIPIAIEPREGFGQVHTIASFDYPQQDVIELARQRGTILAVVRMGDIDLEKAGKPIKVELGDDGIQGRLLRVDKGAAKAKPNDNRADQLAKQLEHLMRDVDTVNANYEALRQQLEESQLEVRSLRVLLERKERELKKPK